VPKISMYCCVFSLVLSVFGTIPLAAEESARVPTQQEINYYAYVVVPTLETISKAVPTAPEGWVVENKTVIEPVLGKTVTNSPGAMQYDFSISYRRVDGVAEETKQLEDAYQASKAASEVESLVRLADLREELGQFDANIRVAQKRNQSGKERKLTKERENIVAQIEAVPAETEKKIRDETEPLLVRDAGVTIRVSLNVRDVTMPGAKGFTRPRCAFAVRVDGAREGLLRWREGRSLVLYGDWEEVRPNVFHAVGEWPQFSPAVRTIAIELTGDATRVEQFLKRMALKDIVGLMK
jgi:hypothetical protein